MVARTTTLQLTFFLALAAAARLGTAVLAGWQHPVWMRVGLLAASILNLTSLPGITHDPISPDSCLQHTPLSDSCGSSFHTQWTVLQWQASS